MPEPSSPPFWFLLVIGAGFLGAALGLGLSWPSALLDPSMPILPVTLGIWMGAIGGLVCRAVLQRYAQFPWTWWLAVGFSFFLAQVTVMTYCLVLLTFMNFGE